jgi:hypothetical protein
MTPIIQARDAAITLGTEWLSITSQDPLVTLEMRATTGYSVASLITFGPGPTPRNEEREYCEGTSAGA